MKNLISILIFSTSVGALAHDEGHGPKLTDTAKQGGIVSPVVAFKDAPQGGKAALVYKAELVRSEDGTIHVYYYDKDMKPLDMTRLAKTAKATLAYKKKKKWVNEKFTLDQKEGSFSAKAPKAGAKPFNIDIVVQEGERELLSAFDNLD